MNSRFKYNYKLNVENGCWEWQKYCQNNGYGQCKSAGKMVLAHRLSWEIYYGPIPAGMCVLHKCDNPACVNPKHLWIGTNDDNSKDMVSKQRQAHVRGELNGSSKLTENEALRIRFDKRTYGVISKDYSISIGVIRGIKAHKLWTHV